MNTILFIVKDNGTTYYFNFYIYINNLVSCFIHKFFTFLSGLIGFRCEENLLGKHIFVIELQA